VRNDRTRLASDAGVQEFLNELATNYAVVCITDHMRSEYATRLAKAALTRDDITVLPGMEINCEAPPAFGDCIHLLAVFPPDADAAVIERIFAGRGLPGPSARTGTEAVRFDALTDLRDRIHDESDGLFILAHVENSRRGHRARFIADRGETLRLWLEGEEHKVDLADEYAVYLANLEPDAVELQRVEHQQHYAPFVKDGKECRVACVAPADPHSLEDYGRREMATLLKIPRADFRSVREALRFYKTRVRLPGQATEHSSPRLVGLRIASPSGEGLFEDTTIAFSPNLTCLIGPRGSGKSTVIEALRYVLGLNPQLTERTRDEAPSFANLAQGIQQANLEGTRLELVYETADGAQTILSATFDPAEDVTTRAFSLAGDDLHVSALALPTDFPVSLFSWSEMEVLGRQGTLQRELVDRLLGGIRPLIAERDRLVARLAENRARIGESVRTMTVARRASSGLLGRYRQYLEAFQVVNTEEAAALFSGLDAARQRRELLRGVDAVLDALAAAAEELASANVAARVAAVVDTMTAAAQEWWASGPREQLDIEGLDSAAREAAQQLAAHISARRLALEQLVTAADGDLERIEQDLREQTRLEPGQDVLRDQRELARRRYEEVDAARAGYLNTSAELDEALAERAALLVELRAAQDAVSARRAEQLGPLNERLAEVGGERLQITVEREHLADRATVRDYLNEHILNQERGGQYLQRRLAERLCKMARPASISTALVNCDAAALAEDLAIGVGDALTPEEADKLVLGCAWRAYDKDAAADVVNDTVLPLLAVAEQPVDDLVRIKLNGRPVDELSPGQRSSAMLPLIALAETDPLIIDQPEDNLDNAMVGETLTRILADLKERRQIIVTTHNPNIVVGGDAEQVAVLNADGAHAASVTTTGSIDEEEVITAVLTIMEGGREAFIERGRRYGVE
jgi:ABC-type Mn2+/Zn2+ transport system ATPase subunit